LRLALFHGRSRAPIFILFLLSALSERGDCLGCQ
jgi:hypothetical protein